MGFLGCRGWPPVRRLRWNFGLGKGPPALAPNAQASSCSELPAATWTGIPVRSPRDTASSQVTRKMQVMSRIGVSVPFRLILHDRRGTGLSSRNVPAPTLETRVEDLLTVLDAVGAPRPVLLGGGDSGAANALFASSHPGRAASLIWLSPEARSVWAPRTPCTPSTIEPTLTTRRERGGGPCASWSRFRWWRWSPS